MVGDSSVTTVVRHIETYLVQLGYGGGRISLYCVKEEGESLLGMAVKVWLWEGVT